MTHGSQNGPSADRIDVRKGYYTFLGAITMLMPALMVAGAAFAPTARGPIIASLFLLPPILFVVARTIERLRGNYSMSIATAPVPLSLVMGILAAFLLPYAFLEIGTPYLWWIWACLACALVAGIIIGLARHDKEELRRVLARRFSYRDGKLIENMRVKGSLGMRASTGSTSLDLFAKVAWGIYAVIITVGMFLGGGAAFVLGSVLDGLVPRPAELDIRVIVIEIVALLAMGPLGVWLPVFWRMWRGIMALERRTDA